MHDHGDFLCSIFFSLVYLARLDFFLPPIGLSEFKKLSEKSTEASAASTWSAKLSISKCEHQSHVKQSSFQSHTEKAAIEPYVQCRQASQQFRSLGIYPQRTHVSQWL